MAERQTGPLRLRKFPPIFLYGFVLWLGAASLGVVSLQAQQQRQGQQQGIVAEPNLQLFTVLAAVNAAGFDVGAGRPELAPMRYAVRKELAAKDIPSLPALRVFYGDHQLFDPSRDLGQYVSLALLLSGPPSFELQVSPANLPPDVVDLQDLVPLIAAFYQEAGIQSMWEKYLPAMEQESERYQKALARTIVETNSYLRVNTPGYWNRRFAIYINPLGAPNQTHARSYGDDYFIVASPSAEIPEQEIQHGWLHYHFDPYLLKYGREVAAKQELLKITEQAPALDVAFQRSFSLLLTESLIQAVQARRSPADSKAKLRAVEDAVEEGFFLTTYFFEAMEVFEQQPVGMRRYYPEMIEAISVEEEQERIAQVQFRAQPAEPRSELLWFSYEQMARRGEDSIGQGDYEGALRIFEGLAKQYDSRPRTLYGLAIVATRQNKPVMAKQYFTQVAASNADPHLKAWSHIYLGRMLDMEGNREAAQAEYAAALAAGDSSAETRAAAEKGMQEEFAPAGRESPPQEIPREERKPRHGVPLG